MREDKTVTITDWRTPVTDYPARKLGKVEIRKVKNALNTLYYMEGVRGHLYCEYKKSAPITALKISGKIWMTDDPQYVWSLESFAERAKGKVLVAGLGLGIVVHQLVKNPAVTEINVIERNMDVIRLVQPLLPNDPRIHVIEGDFYEWCDHTSMKTDFFPDTVIWDLAVGTPGTGMTEGKEIVVAEALIFGRFNENQWNGKEWAVRKDYKPATIFIHGLDRDPVGEKFAKTKEFRRVHALQQTGILSPDHLKEALRA